MAEEQRVRVIHPHSEESKTQQAHKDEANINSILKRWRYGHPVPEEHRNPHYGDFSGVADYHTELNRIQQAHEQFLRLPAEVRKAVHNDVGEFLEKCTTTEGLEELKELGLDMDLSPPRKAPEAVNRPGNPEVHGKPPQDEPGGGVGE